MSQCSTAQGRARHIQPAERNAPEPSAASKLTGHVPTQRSARQGKAHTARREKRTGAVRCVEVDGGAAEAQEQAVAVVGVGYVKRLVAHQLLHQRHVAGRVGAGLREIAGKNAVIV